MTSSKRNNKKSINKKIKKTNKITKESPPKDPWYREFINRKFHKSPVKLSIVLVTLLLIYWLFYAPDNNYRLNQMVYPVDFSRIKEGLAYDVVATVIHVFLRVFLDNTTYITCGITTLSGREGVYLSVPDLVSMSEDFGIKLDSYVVSTEIGGLLTKVQADYLKSCFVDNPSERLPRKVSHS